MDSSDWRGTNSSADDDDDEDDGYDDDDDERDIAKIQAALAGQASSSSPIGEPSLSITALGPQQEPPSDPLCGRPHELLHVPVNQPPPAEEAVERALVLNRKMQEKIEAELQAVERATALNYQARRRAKEAKREQSSEPNSLELTPYVLWRQNRPSVSPSDPDHGGAKPAPTTDASRRQALTQAVPLQPSRLPRVWGPRDPLLLREAVVAEVARAARGRLKSQITTVREQLEEDEEAAVGEEGVAEITTPPDQRLTSRKLEREEKLAKMEDDLEWLEGEAPGWRRKLPPDADVIRLVDMIEPQAVDWAAVARAGELGRFGHSAHDCQMRWTQVEDPRLRPYSANRLVSHGKTSSRMRVDVPFEEDEALALRKAVEMFGEHAWLSVAEQLKAAGFVGRLPMTCHRYWRTRVSMPIGTAVRYARWTPEDDANLTRGVKGTSGEGRVRRDWVRIARNYLNEKFTSDQCLQRWRYSVSVQKKGLWNDEEIQELRRQVDIHGDKNWESWVPDAMGGRSAAACREKWTQYLKPGLTDQYLPWRPDEDSLLRDEVKRLGESNWAGVVVSLPGRTRTQCRRRWLSLNSTRGPPAKPMRRREQAVVKWPGPPDCGQCDGCMREEDCGECQQCLKHKMLVLAGGQPRSKNRCAKNRCAKKTCDDVVEFEKQKRTYWNAKLKFRDEPVIARVASGRDGTVHVALATRQMPAAPVWQPRVNTGVAAIAFKRDGTDVGGSAMGGPSGLGDASLSGCQSDQHTSSRSPLRTTRPSVPHSSSCSPLRDTWPGVEWQGSALVEEVERGDPEGTERRGVESHLGKPAYAEGWRRWRRNDKGKYSYVSPDGTLFDNANLALHARLNPLALALPGCARAATEAPPLLPGPAAPTTAPAAAASPLASVVAFAPAPALGMQKTAAAPSSNECSAFGPAPALGMQKTAAAALFSTECSAFGETGVLSSQPGPPPQTVTALGETGVLSNQPGPPPQTGPTSFAVPAVASGSPLVEWPLPAAPTSALTSAPTSAPTSACASSSFFASVCTSPFASACTSAAPAVSSFTLGAASTPGTAATSASASASAHDPASALSNGAQPRGGPSRVLQGAQLLGRARATVPLALPPSVPARGQGLGVRDEAGEPTDRPGPSTLCRLTFTCRKCEKELASVGAVRAHALQSHPAWMSTRMADSVE